MISPEPYRLAGSRFALLRFEETSSPFGVKCFGKLKSVERMGVILGPWTEKKAHPDRTGSPRIHPRMEPKASLNCPYLTCARNDLPREIPTAQDVSWMTSTPCHSLRGLSFCFCHPYENPPKPLFGEVSKDFHRTQHSSNLSGSDLLRFK
jgi:hypothetical protein